MRHCESINHPNKSVIGTPQCQILHQILKQSVATCNTNGMPYGTVGVLITLINMWLVLHSVKYFYQILIQSVVTFHTIGVLYDTVGVLITVLLLPLKSLFQFRNLNILFGINLSGTPLLWYQWTDKHVLETSSSNLFLTMIIKFTGA